MSGDPGEEVRDLERRLGDPRAEGSPFHPDALGELDEQGVYPADACAALDAWGLHARFVPRALGGRLDRFDALLALLRVVARRDLTVAIAYGKTFLGAVGVWVAGSAAQRARCAQIIGRPAQLALALTERDHGADLASGALAAELREGSWRIAGEKWLINNATRSAALTVLARTSADGGPRGFSMFFVEKESLAQGAFAHLPRIRTHGIRGADISGIRFDDADVGPDALVGAAGDGLLETLRSLQVTRTLCAGLSLGAGDAALRTVMPFARERVLYGAPVLALPYPRGLLADALAELLACECASMAAARLQHVAPEEASVASAVVKYAVPVTVGRLIDDAALVLGARHYLRDGRERAFQKILRDHALVGLFDGSTAVNLAALATMLPGLLRGIAKPAEQHLSALFQSGAVLPAWDATRLALSSRGRDGVLAGLSAGLDALSASALEPAIAAPLAAQAVALRSALARTGEGVARILSTEGPRGLRDPEAFELARDYTELWLAAASIQTFVHDRERLVPSAQDGAWLVGALARRLRRFAPRDEVSRTSPEIRERLVTMLGVLVEAPTLGAISLWA